MRFGGTQETGKWFQRVPLRVLVWSILLVAAVSLWVFRPVLFDGFVHWDDHIYLAELERMGGFSWSSLTWMWTSVQPFYLQPIAWMTHLADYQIWGSNPVGHHATNWILHGVYVALVGTLVWMLAGKVDPVPSGTAHMRRVERLALAMGIALVCGIHPLQVESVAWVSARNGLLCSVWMVAALCAYVRADGHGERERGWWWTTVGLYVVALLTKPFAVSLPLVMLALDFYPLRRHAKRGWWRLVLEKWFLIALSLVAAMEAIVAQPTLEGLRPYTLGSRVLVAAHGMAFYVWKLMWPAWLSPFYPLSSKVSLRSTEFWVPLLFCVVMTVVAVLLRRRAPVLLAAWWSYLALLLPVSGLVQVGRQAVADRYAYLAMVPVLLVLGSGVLWIWRHMLVWRIMVLSVIVAGLPFLGLRTRQQIAVWHDDVSLWNAALAHFPKDPLANYNLALALVREGRLTDARGPAERTVMYSDPRATQLPEARATLGVIYLKTHQYDQAVEQLREAVAADTTLWAARYNLACAYARLGQLADAYKLLQEVVGAQPEYASLAARDGELKALRDDPEYGARLHALIGDARNIN
jgi:protein O-mannosyl-transferase